MSSSEKKMTPDEEAERCRLAAGFLEVMSKNGRFDEKALGQVRDIRTEPGFCSCVLPVTEDVENRYGTLHGGCIATIVDVCTTAALMTVSSEPGVSIDLNVTYMNACPHGEEVLIESKLLKLGSNISTLSCDVRSVKTGRLLAQGRHSKFVQGGSRFAARQSKL